MKEALKKLVYKGRRGWRSWGVVLRGASGVSLDMVGRPGTAHLVMSDPPIIPAAQTGGSVQNLLARINNLPIEEIAGHLRNTAAKMDTLVSDPALSQSLQRLESSLAEI